MSVPPHFLYPLLVFKLGQQGEKKKALLLVGLLMFEFSRMERR